MKTLKTWLPSFIVILASALFLLLTLRGLGPSGNGVSAMVAMQAAWKSAPAIHASGTIIESAGGVRRNSTFELWEAGGHQRMVQFGDASPHRRKTVVITPDYAWEQTGDLRPMPTDPARADLFPIPDPDAADNTFYRTARHWALGPQVTFRGDLCQQVRGTAQGAVFIFDLDLNTHLPRRVRIAEKGVARPRRWEVDFITMTTPAGAAPRLFQKRV